MQIQNVNNQPSFGIHNITKHDIESIPPVVTEAWKSCELGLREATDGILLVADVHPKLSVISLMEGTKKSNLVVIFSEAFDKFKILESEGKESFRKFLFEWIEAFKS